MKSVMSHQFSMVPKVEIQRSVFDRSHGYKTTFDAGYLIPFFVDEVLPGDSMTLRANGFARFATPIKVPMDNVYLDTFFFFVPNRLLWENWTKFMGERTDPDSSIDYTLPYATTSGDGVGITSLSAYMGIPIYIPNLVVCTLWHRAYSLIWREWFRDQNLQDSPVVDLDNGPDDLADYPLRRRNKRHDYFTSCLPWPQKGSAVSLPLGTTAPVVTTDQNIHIKWTGSTTDRDLVTHSSDPAVNFTGAGAGSVNAIKFGSQTGLQVNLAGATAATINSLRQAFQIQRLLERDARGGTRYAEILKSQYGVIDPQHAVLQRPVFLGGGRSYVNFHPVAQTMEQFATTVQGNLASFGTASIQGHGFTQSFTEHGVLIGLICCTADLTYQQGLNRMFSRRTRYDVYFPALSHIGEQAVYNKEIYAVGSGGSTDDQVFGYQERFAEYRYKPSLVTGLFNSTATDNIDIWHLSQEFGSLPALNSTFIEENPPIDRIIAVPSEPHLIMDFYLDYKCARPMPLYGVPGMIDHF